ncbi:MAG: hypothetical protein FWB88_08440 [Defluviitaleaceae bacterium]|nr:hypothetical protein [Defluviitaleaceae bacterium]MCL2239987.1 hypothetical protein [Defluviitaleaceae bacterium]
MRLHTFRKRIALWLAVVMAVGVIAPFGAFAAPPHAPGPPVPALGGTLEIRNDRALLPEAITGLPQFESRTLPYHSAMLHWPVTPIAEFAGDGGMHVLRHFNHLGQRIELTLRNLEDGQLRVNFDVFARAPGAGVFYRSLSDPLNTTRPNYIIHTFGGTITAVDYFARPDLVMQDDSLNRRVNNSRRFAQAYGGNFYTTYASYPNTAPLTGAALTELTPSFTLAPGSGFSFIYGGMRVHIWWQGETLPGSLLYANTFYVFYENMLQRGLIYEFELDYFPALNFSYHTSNVANTSWVTPTAPGPGTRPDRLNAESAKRYHFTGLRNFAHFPFANVDGERHTLPYYRTNLGTWRSVDRYEAGPPAYRTDPIHLPCAQNPPNSPANSPNGLDIRFDMPMMFSEDFRGFHATPHDRLTSINARLSVSGHPVYNFSVDIDLSDLSGYTFSGAEFNSPALPELTQDAEAFLMTPLPDSPARYATVVSVRVEGFPPSLHIPAVTLTLSGSANVSLNLANNAAHIPGVSDLYTFLDFNFVDLGYGPRQIRIQPFNVPQGWYRIRYAQANFTPANNSALTFPGSWVQRRYGDTGPVFLPIPLGMEGLALLDRAFQIEFSTTEPGAGINILSQYVVYTPDPRPPNVGLPVDFYIRDVALRPVLDNPRGLTSTTHGNVSFTLQWLLGSNTEIKAMLDKTAPLAGSISLDYIIRHSESPVIDDYRYEDFLGVRIHITETYPESFMITDPTTFTVSYTLHEIIPDPNPDVFMYMLGPNPPAGIYLVPPPGEPTLLQGGMGAVMADIRLRTHANHRSVYPRTTLHFPGVHFFYVQARAWRTDCLTYEYDAPLVFRTGERSLTLSNLTRPTPPAPADLTVAVITEENPGRENINNIPHPASLDVRFDISRTDFLHYLSGMHEFRPHVSANLYITAFEDAFAALLPDPGETLPPGEWEARSTDPARIEILQYNADWGWAVDLSGQGGVLRGEQGERAIVRITNIPLSTPSALSVDAADFFHPLPDDLPPDALTDTWSLFDLTVPGAWLTLFGLDENRQYYLFADLIVTPYTPVLDNEAVSLGQLGEPGVMLWRNNYPQTSATSAVVAETTPGTPQVPIEPEIDPTAPQWVRVQDDSLGMTFVTIEWQPVLSLPNTIMEYDIIRVRDVPLTEAQMQSRETDIGAFLASLAQPGAKGWRTSGPALLVPIPNGFEPASPYAYSYGPSLNPAVPAWLSDGTLTPNVVYFYYVRARQVGEGGIFTVSTWVGTPVTTTPVEGPSHLRLEDGTTRAGFDPQRNVFVSFRANFGGDVNYVASIMGEDFYVEMQLRQGGGQWTVPTRMSLSQLQNIMNLRTNPDGTTTFYYMVTGLRPGSMYEMRVRLYHIESGSPSLWTEVLVFITEADHGAEELEREADNWLNHLRRLLLEQTRQPFWIAADTPDILRVVYRPDAFRNLIEGTPGMSIPLHNTGARTTIYYLPIAGILELNDHRRGLTTRYEDMDVTFAPRFLNPDHNRAIMDMARNVSNRNVAVNDYFVRVALHRQEVVGNLHGNPPLTDSVEVQIELVGVNQNTRNIRTWDTQMANRVAQFIDSRVEDPIVRQNIINLVDRSDHRGVREEYHLLDYLATVEAAVAAEINRMVTRDIPTASNAVGIIATQRIPVVAFDAPMHIVATNVAPDTGVTAFTQVRYGAVLEWRALPTTEQGAGFALVAQAPGVYAFAGAVVNIPGIEHVPGGQVITSLVARFGLTGVFGQDEIDLHRHATRHMVMGSVARLAGAPANANPVNWVASYMNVTPANRNAQGLISQQETLAMVMALYEHRTNTRVSSMLIRNHTLTAGMNLDGRYAQAVRAGFEIGIVADLQPAAPVTIGDLLDMLVALDGRIGL